MCSIKIEEKTDQCVNSDMNMFASKTFDNILNSIKDSNLNFHLQLSPFSAIISLKKSLVCDKLGTPLLPSHQIYDNKDLIARNQQLEAEMMKLETKYTHFFL